MRDDCNHENPRDKRFQVVVPQHFVQVFYVNATSRSEAIALVQQAGQDPEAGDDDISSSDPEFVEDLPAEHWQVSELRPDQRR